MSCSFVPFMVCLSIVICWVYELGYRGVAQTESVIGDRMVGDVAPWHWCELRYTVRATRGRDGAQEELE